MEQITAIVLLIGLAVGIFLRNYVPYSRKMAANKIEGFNAEYLWTAITSFAAALVTAIGMIPQAAEDWVLSWWYGTGYIGLFVFGVFWAIGINTTLNQAILDGKPARRR